MATYNRDVYAELLEVAPELRPIESFERISDAEYTLRNSGQQYSEADLQYVRDVESKNPEIKKTQEPLLYVIFEDEFWDLIVDYLHEPARKRKLMEIMAWLEDLANDADSNTQNLVQVAICEQIVISDRTIVEHLFPLIGEKTRQLCVECFPAFHVEENVKRLFEKNSQL